MIIGVPREIKDNEYRVATTPMHVKDFVSQGHSILIEEDAGFGSGYENQDYIDAGAKVVKKDDLYKNSELIYKVKEFFPEEFKYFREDLIIVTYIHSNAFPKQTDALLDSKVIGIAYEDIKKNGEYPLLKPMSKIAGMGGFIKGIEYMQKIRGGSGVLPVNLEGVSSAEIIILGAGNSGLAAAELAAKFGNKVKIFEIDISKMERARELLPPNVETIYSSKNNIKEALKTCDLLINCVLWPKWKKESLITRKMINKMKNNSLIVDVSCDEDGAIETSRPTSHTEPIFKEEGVLHYAVDNIPAAYSATATKSLAEATYPFVLEIANNGIETVLKDNKILRSGLSFYKGKLTIEETALKQNREYVSPEDALGIKEDSS